MSIIDELITDRIGGEKYDYEDLNRVEQAVVYIKNLFNEAGMNPNITLHGEWHNGDDFTETDMTNYLNNIKTLRNCVQYPYNKDVVPDTMNDLTAVSANIIEKILVELDKIYKLLQLSLFYSGEGFSGEF